MAQFIWLTRVNLDTGEEKEQFLVNVDQIVTVEPQTVPSVHGTRVNFHRWSVYVAETSMEIMKSIIQSERTVEIRGDVHVETGI